MGYLHIENLYRNQNVLAFAELYALEKIHGTSAHISFKNGELTFFSGGESYDKFRLLFDAPFLTKALASFGKNVTVYGEAYGGKQQGMRATYGDELKFVVFDVKFDDQWLTVPNAEHVARMLKLEFVHYKKIKSNLTEIDAERDADSEQAIRNGVGAGKIREGVVLRPLEEMVDERGNRLIAKHKRDEFRETKSPRTADPDRKKAEMDAQVIAYEWVTEERLRHVLDHAQALLNAVKGLDCDRSLQLEDTKQVIEMMIEDVKREAKGEIVESKEATRAIGSRTAKLYKDYLKRQLVEGIQKEPNEQH